jgi:hypothetical protein
MFDKLLEGEDITYTLPDNSLYPTKKKGDKLNLFPNTEINIGDIVCYELEGVQALGIVKAVNPLYGVLVGGPGPTKTKGWTHTILGKVV